MRGRQCDVRRTLPQLLALEMREGALIQGMGVGSNLEMARKWILPRASGRKDAAPVTMVILSLLRPISDF